MNAATVTRPVMPLTSVRGRIRAFIERHAHRLGNDVLEIGSGIGYDGAWFRVNRDLAQGKWTGIDMQAGPNVDHVMTCDGMPEDWSNRFTGAVCSEVLEHMSDPIEQLEHVRYRMQPEALIVVTTLFAFPVHGFPNDFFRYSTAGLAHVLRRAGFSAVAAEYAGEFVVELNDHGEDERNVRQIPIHTFATARA